MEEQFGRWRTAIGHVEPDRIVVRGYDLNDLIRHITFAEMIYLVLKGDLPTSAQARMIDALLVSVVEHGISPSSTIARFLSACGVPIQVSVAGGLLSFGDIHGGAGQAFARLLQDEVTAMRVSRRSVTEVAAAIVKDHRDRGDLIPGFGHPQHPSGDPRVPRLLEIADETGTSGEHVALARAIEEALASSVGRRIPMNVDGAIGAILSDLGFDWRLARVFMIVPRAAGLAAHALEEIDREGGWRQIPLTAVTYDGPSLRQFPANR